MKPQVSVIIPVYNTSDFLRTCLDSICAQTLQDIEIICVDDGSTDDSLSILETYRDSDERITVLTQQNQFAGTARNNGMAHATGEYLMFFDSDDFMKPNMLESLVDRANDTGADIVACNADLFDDVSQETTPCTYGIKDFGQGDLFKGPECADHIFQIFLGWPWDKLFRHSFISQSGLKFQSLRSSNDVFFVFSALAEASSIATIDDILAVHRVHNLSSIENTRDLSSLCFVEPVKAIGAELREKGLYELYEQSFINWVAEFSIWQITTLKPEKQEEAFEAFHTDLLPLIDIDSRAEGFFQDPDYFESLKILAMPAAQVRVNLIHERHHYQELDRYYHEEQEMRYGAEGAVRDLKEIIEAQKEEIAAKEAALVDLDHLLLETNNELNEIKASKAYRLGNSLAKPVRAIKHK